MKYEDVMTFIERKKCFMSNEDSEALCKILKSVSLREEKELMNIKERADLEFRKGNYQEAVEFYTSYLTLNNENHIVYSNRAATYQKLNLKMEAIKDCEEGIKLCPTFYKFYLRLGILYLEDDLDKAINFLKRGLEIDPENNVLEEQLKLANEKINNKIDNKIDNGINNGINNKINNGLNNELNNELNNGDNLITKF